MARDFDGVDDRIDLANEANFDFERTDAFSVLAWEQGDGNTFGAVVAKQDLAVASDDRGWLCNQRAGGANPTYQWELANFSGNRIATRTTAEFASGVARAIGWTYDGSSLAAGALIYVDGVSQAKTDIADTLSATILNDVPAQLGARNGAAAPAFFLDGKIGFVVVAAGVLTAADVNRHRWWGCAPGGPSTMRSWHPLWTDSLIDKGTAGGDGTASGTAMFALPRVERCHAAMLGVGR